MSDAAPVVYILHGDDEFSVHGFLGEMEAKMGDPSSATMNIDRLDGRSFNLDELPSLTAAMPFLAKRRLVVLEHPLARIKGSTAREKFLSQLEKIPPTTALVLIEYRPLTAWRDRRKGKLHWLEKWAQENEERAYLREFVTPKGAAMAHHIQEEAGQAGGQFTYQAAALLAALVDGDPRLAHQEIKKLLAYVNYSRPVEIDDVENLTADVGQGDIFVLVDALGNQNGRQAMAMLQRLLEQQDPFSIFGMIVRQFRLLLLTREVLDNEGNKNDVIRDVRVAPFVADKLMVQARRFSLSALEGIYCRLLDVDEGIKIGEQPADLALDTLVATLTNS